MAAKTSAVTCLVFYIKIVAGYYCDSDKCSDDEYCCGYNLCCKSYKVWDMWYFWCGLLFFMFLLSMCGCLWKLRSRSPLVIGGYSYAPLKQEPTYVQTCSTDLTKATVVDSDCDSIFGKFVEILIAHMEQENDLNLGISLRNERTIDLTDCDSTGTLQETLIVTQCAPGGIVAGASEAHPEPQGLPPPYSQPHFSPHKSASPPPAYAQIVAHRN